MELRHLRYFVAVAEEGTVTRAAERLGIQQPPLGLQIRALEEEIGVDLFDRMPKRIILNPAGKIFLEDARRVLAEVDEMVRHVRRFERGEQGKLALGFTSSASLHQLAPQIIQEFLKNYPYAEIEVEERETYELIKSLLERKIDAAFLRVSSIGYEELGHHIVDSEPILVAFPVEHRFATSDGEISLSDLAGERFVIYPRETDGPGFLKDIMGTLVHLRIPHEITDVVQRILSALNLVAAGRGLTFVPASMRVMHSNAILYRKISGNDLPRLPLYLVFRRDIELNLAKNFLSIAKEFRITYPKLLADSY